MTESTVGNDTKDTGSVGNATETKEKFVPVEAYEGVAKDMHKNKARVKELEARLAEKEAKEKADAQAKLEAEKKYEELYKQTQQKLVEVDNARLTEREKFLEATKANALLQELGGVAKREYIRHANLKAIELNEDGTVNDESLKKEAERFRQEHFVLLKNFQGSKLPNSAPKTQTEQKPDFVKATFSGKKEMMKAALAEFKGVKNG